MTSTAPPPRGGYAVQNGTAGGSTTVRALEELRDRVTGALYTVGDPGWDQARTPWELTVVQTPLAVLEVRDAADVQAAVRWAVEYDRQVIAQPVGHGANDPLDGVLLLRTRCLTGIDIDLQRRTAWVGAGVKSGELSEALDGTGLTFLAGSNPDTSVVGLTLGGGLSWFGRAYGLGANSIVTVELIDGTGHARSVSRSSDPGLFWAIRGGGGDFGIVTRMEVALHPAPALYGGRLLWPVTRMGEVLRAFRTVTASAPPELTVWYHTYRFPPLPQVPEPVRGKAFASVAVAYLGGAADAERLLAPLRAVPGVVMDQMRPVPLGQVAAIADEPTAPATGKDTSELLTGLDDTTIDRLVDLLGENSTAPLALLQIRHLGAAFTEDEPGHGAAGHLTEPYLLFARGNAASPAVIQPIRAALAEVRTAVEANATGRTVPNFLNAGGDVDRCWTPAIRDRLAAVKTRVDPLSTIRSNRSVHRNATDR